MKRHSDIPINELVLRKYEKPYELKDRELVRKFMLSIGLLQPGDSRDVIVDIFHVLLKARKGKELLSSEEVMRRVKINRDEHQLKQWGVALSNVRRQLRRIKDMMLVEKFQTKYRITEFDALETIINERINAYILKSTTDRILEYAQKIDDVK